jgi:5-methylcytosine-specific restriction enzyme subunit McrC
MTHQNKQITIREYEFLHSKDGEKNYVKNLDDLENFVLKNEGSYDYLKITHKKGYGKVLQAQNFIGVIQLKDGTTIEILPKIASIDDDDKGLENTRNIVVKMLRTLKNSPFKELDKASLKSTKMPLFEVFISMFLAELAKLVQRGIKSDYVDKEENLAFLKGKLKFGDHLKQNLVHKERFFVAYQEFMADRLENRLIKTTLEYLYKKSKNSSNQQRIRELLFVFDDISVSHDPKNDFDKVKLNRQMKDYEQILLWSKMFLLGHSFSPHKGDDIAFALLFDMNLLFESYVGHWLKKNCHKWDISLQDKTHHLAYASDCCQKDGKFQLKPDIVMRNKDNNEIVIADTKWKLLFEDKTNQGVSQGDMYQMFAYGKKYHTQEPEQICKQMYLIYPKPSSGSEPKELQYCLGNNKDESSNLELQVKFFDLSKLNENTTTPISLNE